MRMSDDVGIPRGVYIMYHLQYGDTDKGMAEWFRLRAEQEGLTLEQWQAKQQAQPRANFANLLTPATREAFMG